MPQPRPAPPSHGQALRQIPAAEMVPISRNHRRRPRRRPARQDKRPVGGPRHAHPMTRRTGTGIALLADGTRRTIVALIALRPRHPSELARELGLSRPAVSRQLSLLTRAGLLRVATSRVDRRGRVYRLDPEEQGRITAWLAGTDIGLEEALISRLARTLDGSANVEPSRSRGLAERSGPGAPRAQGQDRNPTAREPSPRAA